MFRVDYFRTVTTVFELKQSVSVFFQFFSLLFARFTGRPSLQSQTPISVTRIFRYFYKKGTKGMREVPITTRKKIKQIYFSLIVFTFRVEEALMSNNVFRQVFGHGRLFFLEMRRRRKKSEMQASGTAYI